MIDRANGYRFVSQRVLVGWFAGLALAALATSTMAADITWTGNQDNQWNNPLNWIDGGGNNVTPGVSDKAIIGATSTNPIISSSSVTVGAIEMLGGILSVNSSSLIVTGTSVLNGHVLFGANSFGTWSTLTIGSSGLLSAGSNTDLTFTGNLTVNSGKLSAIGANSVTFVEGGLVDINGASDVNFTGTVGVGNEILIGDGHANFIQWSIDVDSTSLFAVSFVRLYDSHGGGSGVPLIAINSFDLGNNDNWVFSAGPPVAAIPEPETYAMLLAGLGFLGFMARRRKLKEASAV